MANSNLTAVGITRKALRILHNKSALLQTVNRQYSDRFSSSGATPGDTIDIRLPHQFEVRSGAVMNVKDNAEKKVTFQVAEQRGVDLNFGAKELTLEIDDFASRFLVPAMSRLASEIDYLGFTEMYQNVYNQVGTPGTTPNTAKVVLDASSKMDDFAAPMDDQRFLAITPTANASMVDALKGLFQRSDSIGNQYRMGKMGTALGYDWTRTQNINRHTTGGFAGTTLVDEPAGMASGDATIDIDAFTDAAPTVTKGDTFTIAGVNEVNPETKRDTGNLQRFVVTASKTGSTNQILAIAVSPAFITTGAYQTITALPADGAAVTFSGTAATAYPVNMAYHRDALTFATVDLAMPSNANFAARQTLEGVSMRIWKGDDITNDKFPVRIDVLFGWKLTRPELACRVIG